MKTFRQNLILFLLVNGLLLRCLYANGDQGDSQKFLYLLPTPQVTTTSIISPHLHYGWVVMYNTAKFVALAKTFGPVFASFVMVTDLPYVVPSLAIQSGAELEFWIRLKNYKLMKEIATIPHLKSLELLSFAKTDHWGPVSKSRTTQRLVGLTTSQELPNKEELKERGWKEEWGEPIRVENLQETRLRIHFKYRDKLSETDWQPSLEDVHNFKPIPDSIAEAWRKDLKNWTQQSWSMEKLINVFTGHKDNPLQLVGTLGLPDGSHLELGAFAEGAPVRKLLRGGLIAGLMDKPRRWLQERRGKPIEKHLPHASIKVLSTSEKTCGTLLQSLLGKITFAP